MFDVVYQPEPALGDKTCLTRVVGVVPSLASPHERYGAAIVDEREMLT